MKEIGYGFGRELEMSYEQALEKVPAALKEQGFGVLTEIDVKNIMKEKLGEDFRKYKILGACNPPFAHKALSAELEIGLLLPCNVIVYENDEGKATVMAMDPEAALGIVDNPGVKEVAAKVKEKVKSALDSL